MLQSGQRIRISSLVGTWCYVHSAFGCLTPSTIAGLYWGSLVASIRGPNNSTSDLTPLGFGALYQALQAGQLLLGMYDRPGTYYDDSGNVTVCIMLLRMLVVLLLLLFFSLSLSLSLFLFVGAVPFFLPVFC